MRILGSVLALALPLAAQTILITKGAADYQVYQRDSQDKASIALDGKALVADGKSVEARLLKDGFPLSGFDWRPIAKVAKGMWSAKFEQVPTGGPYKLEVRVSGTADIGSAGHLLVGDLWILAGQSNMEGVGNLVDLPQPRPTINSFDMTDQWVEARDPLHRLVDAMDRVHWPRNAQGQPDKYEDSRLQKWMADRRKGAGLGLPFAIAMTERNGVPIGLVPCAHGGTSMDQWSPSLKDKGGDSLYGGMFRRFRAVGGKVKGVLWYQGESDANDKAAPLFAEKFKALVASIRSDFNHPDLPFYYVQIGRHVAGAPGVPWNAVQEAQRLAEDSIPNVGMVTCADCNLDDGIHVSTPDLLTLGVRLANLASGGTKRGPRPASARFENGVITVTFRDVNRRLASVHRVLGFSIVNTGGQPLPLIYHARVHPSQPDAVQIFIQGKPPEGAKLMYGLGRDPVVNLVDEAGMACPVFGPFPITLP